MCTLPLGSSHFISGANVLPPEAPFANEVKGINAAIAINNPVTSFILFTL
ncbi:hypothetical protein THF5G08_100162 [Vibrio jasicida]|nr:hypothetical protein THF5G08_100162 [Vibrio jasicida]